MAVSRLLVAGRYRLLSPVGVGGMGRVWMARDEMLDRDVAVKEFLPPAWMSDADRDRLRIRTLREARSAARLNHPHVVRIYDVVQADGLPWIVMEYVASRSLYQVISEDGPLTAVQAALTGLAVLDALTAAHRAGVLHRDVKPHNVLIGHQGRIVLTDFGLATFVDDAVVSGHSVVVGSPQYVSPERAREGTSTVASDLWSFGATLYAAVEGRSPYERDSAMATLTALATEPPDPSVLAGPLAPVLQGLLRRDPVDRMSAVEVEDHLRRVIRAGTAPGARGSVVARPPLAAGKQFGRATVPAQRRPPPDPPHVPAQSGSGQSGSGQSGSGQSGSGQSGSGQSGSGQSGSGRVRSAPAQRSRRRLVVSAVLLLVVVLLAGGGLLLDRVPGRDPRVTAAPASPTGSAPASPLGSTPTSPSGAAGGQVGGFSPAGCGDRVTAGLPRTPLPGARTQLRGRYALPSGWSYYADASGFVVAVPDGWTYQQVGDTRCFREPGGARTLSVGVAGKPSADPVTACRAEARRLIDAGALPSYAEVAVTPVAYLPRTADWEYRYDASGPGRLHAVTRWASAGARAYALGWVTPEFDWQTNLSYLSMIQASFAPAG